MIETMSQREAERQGADPREIQNISPFVNPAHVLAPPRAWLEGLVREACTWQLFRLRYKNLLRSRYQADPSAFDALLQASEGPRRLVLTCHCLTPHCHRSIAREFLEKLRSRESDPAAVAPPAWIARYAARRPEWRQAV
jgi:hypothetical protein